MKYPSYRSNFIAQGGYGCVYEPHIYSENYLTTTAIPKDIQTIGKLFIDKKEFESEVKNQELVTKRFDTNYAFTLRLYGTSIIERSTISPEEAARCKFLKHHAYAYQIIYEYGGKSIEKSRESFMMLFKNFDALLKGVYKMVKSGYVHLDIKPQNILVNKYLHLSLIDFGLLTRTSEVYTKSKAKILSHRYDYYPPEFLVVSRYYKTGELSFSDIDINYEGFYHASSYISAVLQRYFPLQERQRAIQNCKIEFYSKGGNVIEIFAAYSAPKIDTYMLGMTWLNMLVYKSNKYAEINPLIIDLIQKMVDPNIFTRYSMKNVIQHYQKIKIALLYDQNALNAVGRLRMSQLLHFAKKNTYKNISRLNKNELILYLLDKGEF